MRILRILIALIPMSGIALTGVLFWLTMGVGNSAIQETNAAAIAACILIGSYTLARSLRWIVDAIAEAPAAKRAAERYDPAAYSR